MLALERAEGFSELGNRFAERRRTFSIAWLSCLGRWRSTNFTRTRKEPSCGRRRPGFARRTVVLAARRMQTVVLYSTVPVRRKSSVMMGWRLRGRTLEGSGLLHNKAPKCPTAMYGDLRLLIATRQGLDELDRED